MIIKHSSSGFSSLPIVRSVMAALVATISSAVAWAENPPLLETARYQNAEAVELLLASGADPDTRQNDGATALHWAAY